MSPANKKAAAYANALESLILQAIPGAQVRVEDVRGDGAYFTATVAASAFAGKTRVEQHRMVYAAIKDAIGDKIDRLSIQTVIPKSNDLRAS